MKRTDKEKILTIGENTIQDESRLVGKVMRQLNEEYVEIVRCLQNCEGHVLVTGAGTSNYIAARFAHLLSCCGIPALFIHPADSLHGGAGAIKKQDILFAISKGGETDEVNQLATIAKKRGATIISLTENPNSTLGDQSDNVLVIKVGETDPYGMVATGSSLANAAACDALCVALLKVGGYSKEDFGMTHPEGAVGKKLEKSK